MNTLTRGNGLGYLGQRRAKQRIQAAKRKRKHRAGNQSDTSGVVVHPMEIGSNGEIELVATTTVVVRKRPLRKAPLLTSRK